MRKSEAGDNSDTILCEICGKKIYEDGRWIDETAGVCCGPCEKELCGDCAEWDINGECKNCRNDSCGQCHFGCFRYAEEACKSCEHILKIKPR